MVATAIIGAGVLGAGAAIGGGMLSSNAATNAANTQANEAQNAQNQLLAVGKTASGMDTGAIAPSLAYLQPYENLGTTASGLLSSGLSSGALTAGFNPTMANLNTLPGYQFELQQGLEATQNGFAAKGLGSSGAAIKGAGQYAQGLAANDLNNYANIYYTNQNNAYNRLIGATNTGAAAGANMADINANLTTAGGNALLGSATNAASVGMAGAAAQAAGTVGSANAIANGLTGATGALTNGAIGYGVMNALGGSSGSNVNPYLAASNQAQINSLNNQGMYAPTFGSATPPTFP